MPPPSQVPLGATAPSPPPLSLRHWTLWFSRSTDVTSTDLVSAKGKTKEVYCCDIVVLIVLFWCFCDVWRITMSYQYIENIVWWGCETISISWLLFSPLPKLGQLSGCDISWPREWTFKPHPHEIVPIPTRYPSPSPLCCPHPHPVPVISVPITIPPNNPHSF